MSDKTRNPKTSSPEDARLRTALLYTTLGMLLATVVVLEINYLAFRHYVRWDWTSERRYTLSDRTKQVLRELEDDVTIHFLLSQGEPQYSDVRELLDRYRAESSHVSVEVVDPVRDEAEFRLLAERFGVGQALFSEDGSIGADAAILVTSGPRHWSITRDDLVPVSFDTDEGEERRVDTRSEQAITGGVLEVMSGRRTKLCVTEGHGEWAIDSGSQRDLSQFRDELRRENIDFQTFATRNARRVPEDCDALVIPGPVQAFDSDEANLVRDYVRGGGNLLALLEPELDRDSIRPTGLEDVLRDLGVRVDRALVLELDEGHLVPTRPHPVGPIIEDTYGDHVATRRLATTRQPVVLASVRAVRPIDPARATALLSTSEAAYAETDIAALVRSEEQRQTADDIAGPVSIAVATTVEPVGPEADDEEERAGGRVVVVGDVDAIGGDWLADTRFANQFFFTALVGWLTERDALVEIPPRNQEAQPLRITESDAYSIGIRVVLLLPLAAILLGLGVWWSRRT